MREAEPPVQNVHLDILNKTDGCAMISGLQRIRGCARLGMLNVMGGI
jgi:hypothetical protein